MAANDSSKSTKGARRTPKAGDPVKRAAAGISAACAKFLALKELGTTLDQCAFCGWTANECIKALVVQIETALADAIEPPAEADAAKQVKALLAEGNDALRALWEGSGLLNDAFDGGMIGENGAAVIGAGLVTLTDKACKSFDHAAYLVGVPASRLAFYNPRAEDRI